MDIQTKIGVAGAGTMGTGIAQVASSAGHEVIVFDNSRDALDRSATGLRKTMNRLVEKGKLSEQDAKSLLGRIRHVTGADAFRECGMVIEAIVENLDAKRSLFNEVEKQVDDTCVLATNTSSLSIASVGGRCRLPGRLLGVHFFNPAPLLPLVEVVPGLDSEQGLAEKVRDIVKTWGKVPVIARDTPGFIVNRIARPFYGEALRVYEEGIAGFAEIDAAMKTLGGFRMGPFELMDLIGNDVNYQVTASVWEQMFYDPRYRPSITQQRLFEAGRLGRKAGRGYYAYADGKPVDGVPAEPGPHGEEVYLRILCMLINEAADALYLGIAGKDDIELAMTKGVNYPKGLLHWADELGAREVYESLCRLREDYREDRYRPSLLLKRMAADNGRFFT